MTDFNPLGGTTEFPPINPGNPEGTSLIRSTTVVSSVSIPDGSVTDAKLAFGIDPRKLAGVAIKVYLDGGNQAITAGTTGEDIAFDTIGTNQGFDPPTGATFTTVTVPYDGLYLLFASITWDNIDDGERFMVFEVNGTEVEGERKVAGSSTRTTMAAVRLMTAGDTVGLHVEHDSATDPLDIVAGEDDCSLSVLFWGSF